MDSNFYGWVYMDVYINLAHGIEGKTVQVGLEASTKIVSMGQITGTSITIVPYGGAGDNFPIRSDVRTVNGQLYVYRTSLIPSPLVDSSQNIPVIKLTFKAEGQNVAVNQIVVRKLGIVAGNLVTVRIYQDVDNDTVNRLDGDDVELDAANAGSFVSNAITFAPAFTVVMGVDFNVLVSFSLNLGTAGWTLGCSVNAGEIGSRTALPNNQNAFPNACLNVTRNPPMGMTTPIVPINDRGKLSIYPEDLSPAFPHDDNTYAWMKLTFYAEGENVDVNRIVVRMDNLTGAAPPDWTQIRIMLVGDLNNNSVWNAGDDWLGSRWLDSSGEAAFLAFPLFVARQRTDYNLLIYVYFNWGVNGYVRMNISDDMSIQSKGQVSALSITPTTTFPIMATERRVT
jgi:Fe2+ transport system protein FeoA